MRTDERFDRVKKAIEKAGADGDAGREAGLLENLGDLYLGSDSYDLACAQYDRVIRSDRWQTLGEAEKAGVWFKMARAYLGLGEFDRALRLASKAEKALAGREDLLLLGRVYSLCSQINRRVGNQRDALAYSLHALDSLRRTDDNREIAFVQLTCGSIFLRQGNFTDAVRYFQDSLASYRRLDDQEGIAKAYNNLGVAYKNLCQWENATLALQKAMEIDRRFGNYTGVAMRMLNLGLIQYQRGEWAGSRRRTERSLQMFRGVKDALGVTLCSLALARIDRHRGRWESARRHAMEALRISKSRGNRREIAASFEELGAWYAARGQQGTARVFLERSLSIAEKISERSDHVAEINRRLSEIASHEGDVERAIALAKAGIRVAAEIRDQRMIGLGLLALATACRTEGRTKLAARYTTRSVRIFEGFGIPLDLARTLLEHAVVARRNGDLRTARSALTRAESIFRRLGASGDAARVLIEFARMKIDSDRLEDALILLQKARRALDRETPGADLEEIRSLRLIIEEKFVEGSLSSQNRFLDIEDVPAGDAFLAAVVERLGAARGFLFGRSASGSWRIVGRRKIDERGALSLAEALAPIAGSAAAVRPLVSHGGMEKDAARSYLVAPVGVNGLLGVYVDRPAGHGHRPFGRRDLNYLVAMARRLYWEDDLPGGAAAPARSGFDGIVTRSAKMRKILATLRKLRDVKATILIQGETGTGKGLLACEIAKDDPAPFVTINCADLTETILESELFGHVKNAFTGAGAGKKGLFEVADGGTVFIDEIDKTSRNFQEKLLRVVDRREFKPVGSVDVKHVDCRIICASNRDLLDEVEKRRFLKDLYYRLKVISIVLPPLRERPSDIPALIEHFVAHFSRAMGKERTRVARNVVDLFARYHWPGNVRDLQNEIERAVALASPGETIRVDSLSDELVRFARRGAVTPVTGETSLSGMVGQLESRVIREALLQCRGNKSQVARRLGLTRKGLRNKIVRYGLDS